MQFAAGVFLLLYDFEAPELLHRSITPANLQRAFNKREDRALKVQLRRWSMLINKVYVDKGGRRGTYVVKTVGEKLIAMTLPEVPVLAGRQTSNGPKKRA